MKSNKNIVIREKSINPNEIIKMVFDRKDWGKSYTIFTHGSITVKCELNSYNFEYNSANFTVTIEQAFEENIYCSSEIITFYVDKEDDMRFSKRIINSIINKFENNHLWSMSIIKQLASTRVKTLKHSIWNVKRQDIIDAGFSDDLDEIDALSNEDLVDYARSKLDDLTLDIMNKPYFEELVRETDNVIKELIDWKNFKEKLLSDLKDLDKKLHPMVDL